MRTKDGFTYEDVQLAFDQVQALASLLKLKDDAVSNNEPGMILAQVFPEDHHMIVVFLPGEKAERVYEIIREKPLVPGVGWRVKKLEAQVEELSKAYSEARRIIQRGVDLMTPEQIASWGIGLLPWIGFEDQGGEE